MKKSMIRIPALLLCVCLLIGMVFVLPAGAEAAPAQTSNLADNEYMYDRWTATVNSHLVVNGDATLTRVEYTGQDVTVETYSSELQFESKQTLAMELPLFGGFYSGQTYNFVVFGQENPYEDDGHEVIRIVCYTKSWQRVGSASLYGANTTVPFDAGRVSFAEYGGYLYIRTAHEMYMSSDGRNHQANVMINLRLRDLQITESSYQVSNISRGYVSHSFNQFIAVDGQKIVAVDHGDALPRSVVMIRYYAPAGQDSYLEGKRVDLGNGYFTYSYAENLDVLPIAGGHGDNDTGVSLGGFECSGGYYLIAGNTVDQSAGDLYGQRNIFISVTDKNNFTQSGTTIRYLTNHAGDVEVSNPQFVRVNDDRYAVIWTESDSAGDRLCYTFVDGAGRQSTKIYTAKGVLSDCKPVVFNGKLVWYVTSASAPAFFTIDLAAPENVTHDHIYRYDYVAYPGYYSAGALASSCAVCGAEGSQVEIPAIQGSDRYVVYEVREEPTCTEAGYGYYDWLDVETYSVIHYVFGGMIPAKGHSYENGVCTECGQTADMNGDGKITAFDAQILAEANAGNRVLNDQQSQKAKGLSAERILDWILSLFGR